MMELCADNEKGSFSGSLSQYKEYFSVKYGFDLA